MRILLVEDDIKLADSLKDVFISDGFNMHVEQNGIAAWETACVDNFDLIVLDITLPGMSGLEILRKLRQEKIDTPVILLTARGELEDKILGLDSGADDYLAKPFAIAELLSRVRAILRRDAGLKSPHIELGNIKVNTLSREVRVDGAIVGLTPREYSILELLIFNLNRVVSRLSIAEHVWDENFDLMTNVVDVHIRNLRKKIKDDGELIHSVRGIGYMIKNEKF